MARIFESFIQRLIWSVLLTASLALIQKYIVTQSAHVSGQSSGTVSVINILGS